MSASTRSILSQSDLGSMEAASRDGFPILARFAAPFNLFDKGQRERIGRRSELVRHLAALLPIMEGRDRCKTRIDLCNYTHLRAEELKWFPRVEGADILDQVHDQGTGVMMRVEGAGGGLAPLIPPDG